VSDRVDVGAWRGLNPQGELRDGRRRHEDCADPAGGRASRVALDPTERHVVGRAVREVWAANASVDVSVSRAFGPVSPYVGGAASASLAVERSADVNLDPATAQGGVVYAGVTYGWRTLLLSAEVEKASLVSYAFRVGTRF
jgi:hypothetical protein